MWVLGVLKPLRWGERHPILGTLIWGLDILAFGWMIPGYVCMATIGELPWRTPILLTIAFYSIIGTLLLSGYRFPRGDAG